MLNTFRQWLIRVLTAPPTGTVSHRHVVEDVLYRSASSILPYDENLLERSHTQWQFGDWESLTKLERDTLQHHPDRAKLALLAAAGHLQQGDSQAARQFTQLAQDWGCSKKLIGQILISGVHNSLGRAAAVSGQIHWALQHFQSAIQVGAANSEVRLLTEARGNQQLTQLGFPLNTVQLQNTEHISLPKARTSLPSNLIREND